MGEQRPGMVTRQTLANLYRQRALIDMKITREELALEAIREQYGRLPRMSIPHGDESAYQRHIRKRIPFPEDGGLPPCGCRIAHNRYEARRAAAAEERRNGVQLTVYDALREQRETGAE